MVAGDLPEKYHEAMEAQRNLRVFVVINTAVITLLQT
jgi:hypothetical protein